MDLSSFYFNSTPVDEFISEHEITQLYKNSSEKKYLRGVKIFEERAYPKGVFILKRGGLKYIKVLPLDRNRLFRNHRPDKVDALIPLSEIVLMNRISRKK